MVQISYPYMTTGKTIALSIWTFVSKVMPLLFYMLSRFVIAFWPRSSCLQISWLQSPSTVILEPKEGNLSLLFNMLSRFVIAFLLRSIHLLISWLQSPSAMILEPNKIKSVTVSIVSPSIHHEVIGLDTMILIF